VTTTTLEAPANIASIPEALRVSSQLDAALEWAERGYPVLPLHSADSQGRCSCLKKCSHAGKHPRERAGNDFDAATTDEAQVREWWSRWPDANIGVPTGRQTNLLVVDLDKGGDEAARAEFIVGRGVWGAAVVVGTGSGGRHFWFSRPDVTGRLSHGGDGSPFGIEGIHFRCDGGLIVVPPSRNAAGPYELRVKNFHEIEPPPTRLVESLLASRRQGTKEVLGQVIPEGTRNTALTSVAGAMRYGGLTAEEMLPSLLAVNQRRCATPLSDAEVKAIANSVSRYPPGRVAGPSIEVPVALVDDASLDLQAVAVYVGLQRHADWSGPTAGQTEVGNARLAQALRTSESTIERGRGRLAKSGWVKRVRRGARRTGCTVVLKVADQFVRASE
jgi:hypothetical protein